MFEQLELLAEVPLLAGLSNQELQQLCSHLTLKRVKKKELLFMENDPCHEFYIVKTGAVKLFRFEDSREVIINILQRGDYFGEIGIFMENQLRLYAAQAIETTELCILKSETLLELLEKKPTITKNLLRSTMERLRASYDLLTELTTLNASSRIAQTLLRLAEKHGQKANCGICIKVRLTHQQLADMTNTVRETVTKTLLELQSENLIEIHQKFIYLKDIRALMKRIES